MREDKPRRKRRYYDPTDKVSHHVLYLRASEKKRWPQDRIMALLEAVDKIRSNYSTFDSLLKDLKLVRELREKGISDKEGREDGA